MAQFDMTQEMHLSKNEQIYKACLLQLLGDWDPREILRSQEQTLRLNQQFTALLHQHPLEPDRHSLRAMALGGWSIINADRCFAYIGEYDILLERHDRYFPVAPHTHNYLELMCVVHGSCWQNVGGHLSQVQGGDIILLPPGTYHSFTSFSDDCVVYNLSLQLDDFEARFYNLLRQETVISQFLFKTLYTNQHSAYLVFHSGDYLLRDNVLANIWEMQDISSDLTRPMLNVLAEALFLDLLRVCDGSIEVHTEQTDSIGIEQQIMAYIRLRFRTVSLKELSEVFNYSERHISRIVHQSTGMTLGEYLQQFRLDHIAHLLASTDVSIAAAFDQAGVKNRSYFYKIFRNHFGLTPAQYRAAHSSGTNATD